MPVTSNPQLTSAIMVTCHTGPRLDRAIEAVLAQTSPVELILVNNGNPPEIETALAARAKAEPRIKLVTGHGDIGYGAGNNLGAKSAVGGNLLFLHAEAFLPTTAVEQLRTVAAKTQRPFLLGAKLVDAKGKERPESRRALLAPLEAFVELLFLTSFFPKYGLSLVGQPLPAKVQEIPAVGGACLFLPAEDFRRMKGFDERCLFGVEDMDFCLRFHRAEGKIFFVPGIAVETAKRALPSAEPIPGERKALSLSHYFHENFSYGYPQPVLWLLDVMFWVRLTPHLARRYAKLAFEKYMK